MKRHICGVLVLLCLVCEGMSSISSSDLDGLWATFLTTYGITFPDSATEASHRSSWEDNIMNITTIFVKWDLGLNPFAVGINQYADFSMTEFSQYMLGFRTGSSTNPYFYSAPLISYTTSSTAIANLPTSVNLTADGYVTPVKNQGNCSASWAFAAVGVLERLNQIVTGNLTSLSEEQILMCNYDENEGPYSCSGSAWTNWAVFYVTFNNGISTDAVYPYTASQGSSCTIPVINDPMAQLSSFPSGILGQVAADEISLKLAVATQGPIAAAIDANHWSFYLYASGVYYEPNCNGATPNLAVLVVGYGTCGGQDYWLLKNSWGTSWGQAGYMMLARNRNNHCGIANYAFYVTLPLPVASA